MLTHYHAWINVYRYTKHNIQNNIQKSDAGHYKVRYLLNAAFETQDCSRRKTRILRIRISSYILKELECWMLGDQSSRFRYVYPAVEGYSGSGTGRWMREGWRMGMSEGDGDGDSGGKGRGRNFRVFLEVNGDTREIYTSAIVIPRVWGRCRRWSRSIGH